MPDLWIDVDTAVTVPVNILALTDSGDFVTRETAVAYNAAGMDLVWNFQTTAGVTSQTAVTPTTSGVYDWTHSGDGMYKIEIPASGGASINNDTEGVGWFTGICDGVLHWRGPTIGFRASGLNDALIDSAWSTTRGLAGTALPAVAAEAAGGLYTRGAGAGQIAQAANGQINVNVDTIKTNAVVNGGTITFPSNATLASTTNITAGTITTATNVTTVNGLASNVITAASINANAINAAKLDPDVTTELQAGLATSTSITTLSGLVDDLESRLGTPSNLGSGATIAANLVDIESQTDDIGVAGAGLTALASAANLATVDTVVDAIKVTTDKLDDTLEDDAGTFRFTANALEEAPTGGSAPSAADIADAVWDEATSGHTTSGTFGEQLKTDVDAILADTNELQTDWVNGGRLDNILDARASQTSVDDIPTNAELATALDPLPTAVEIRQEIDSNSTQLAKLGTPAGASISADILVIDNFVDDLESRIGTPSNLGSGATISANLVDIEGQTDDIATLPTASDNATALLDLASGIETGLTPRQALRLITAASAGKLSGAATTTVTIRNAVADSKNRITATVDADGNRSSVSTDLT